MHLSAELVGGGVTLVGLAVLAFASVRRDRKSVV